MTQDDFEPAEDEHEADDDLLRTINKKELVRLYMQADEASREELKPLFAQLGMPVPFIMPQPPEEVTPAVAIAAIKRLFLRSQALGRENARIALGVAKVKEELAYEMLSAFGEVGAYQDRLAAIIVALEQEPGGETSGP